MSDLHTLAAGKPVQSSYARLGGMSGVQVLACKRIVALIIGFPGAGKSHFLESNPDAFIIKADGTSTSNPNTAAVTWPGFDSVGDTIDSNGNKMILTYEAVRNLRDTLLDMAQKNEPRPQTIVIDSLTSMIPLMQKWVPDSITWAKGKKWKECDGKTMWSTLFEEFIDLVVTLRDAGYGVYIVAHLKQETEAGGSKQIIVPNISRGFLTRLAACVELILSVERINKPGINRQTGKAVTVSQHILGASFPDLRDQNVYKFRAPMEIVLPDQGGWSAFEEHYNQQIGQKHQSPTLPT